MDKPKKPQRFALLVGVDFYLEGSRTATDGSKLALRNLGGCVNDVTAIKAFLHEHFQVESPCILTSTAPDSAARNIMRPLEPEDRWPTFINIKREFDAVYAESTAGDFFFFHFSGHGGRLPPISSSPTDRCVDPSLLTTDFCCKQPAVRGWQLNEWLKKLNEKGVQVVVSLDSCYSEAAWREDAQNDHGCFRTPDNWPKFPNVPADISAAQEIITEPGDRDGELENSWSINPTAFTLMAACKSDQKATEEFVGGKLYGAFTHALLEDLRQGNGKTKTYRTIWERITPKFRKQTPALCGRDRLLFFGKVEPFLVSSLAAEVRDRKIHLGIGKLHGVCRGSEFSTIEPPGISFQITHVDDLACNADVSLQTVRSLQPSPCQVIPSRWSFGETTLNIFVESSFGSRFQEWLSTCLQRRITSSVNVGRVEAVIEQDADSIYIKRLGENIGILGPESWIGYSGKVRGLDLEGELTQDLAVKAAVALSHLARFRQLLDLRNLSSSSTMPFEIEMDSNNDSAYPGPFHNGHKHKFTFRNTSKVELFMAVIFFGPGFNVKQLYPPGNFSHSVMAGHELNFSFFVSVPTELSSAESPGALHRDIVRTIVTQGQDVSWASLELPHIWNAGQMEHESLRDGTLLESELGWWVRDREIHTVSL